MAPTRRLSRPLFIYVNKKSLERPEVAEFVKFYLGQRGTAIQRKSATCR